MKKKEGNYKTKILDSAIFLFGTESYETVSVAKICRRAGVSNGIIYKYFKNKTELYKYLLDITIRELSKNLTLIEGTLSTSKLLSYIQLNFESALNERYLISAYREGQYKFIEYEQMLRKDVYLKALEYIYGREVDEVEYLYIMSGVRYVSIKNSRLNPVIKGKDIRDFIAEGIKDNYALEEITEVVLKPEESEKKDIGRILEVGAILFGEKGFHNVKVSDITRLADVSVGSFYLNFDTKEYFFEQIMEKIQRDIIDHLRAEKFLAESYVERVVRILEKLLDFFESEPYKYQLVREAEFISPQVNEAFYSSLEEFLYICLQMEKNEKSRATINCILGIAHYTGIEFYFTKNLKNKKVFFKRLKWYLENGFQS